MDLKWKKDNTSRVGDALFFALEESQLHGYNIYLNNMRMDYAGSLDEAKVVCQLFVDRIVKAIKEDLCRTKC